MKIINKTKNTILAEEVIIADTPFARFKGLLGRKELEKGKALILNPCNSIHTFFMQFTIDVLFVDKNNCVVKAVSNIKPGRMTPIYFKAAFVVELPAGTIGNTQTSPGNTLLIS